MESLKLIEARISASVALIFASPAFAVLFPIAARPRARIPRDVAGNWEHYRPGYFRTSRLQA